MPAFASRRCVLHLVGSAESEFFQQLSLAYARDAIAAIANAERYDFVIAYVSPGGDWQFPRSLMPDDLAGAPRIQFAEAMKRIDGLYVDAVVPQMFCYRGMTSYRSLFDLVGIPVIGNVGSVMAIAADKAMTKAIVSAAGVRTPTHQLRRVADFQTTARLEFPVVVKPSRADNSLGVTLVSDEQGLLSAVGHAFEHGNEVLIEQYIPLGREVRCAVLERNGELVGLPLQEYHVDADTSPIRVYESKLCRSSDGTVDLASKRHPTSWIVDPSDPITADVWHAAKSAHVALGCRDYSLFDFRIDPDGQPWFLEAGLYCSFSPSSIVVAMADAAGIHVRDLFASLVERNVRTRSTRSMLTTS